MARSEDLLDDVWCRTCSHAHIANIPSVTFACVDCGFGAWETIVAAKHATACPGHIVYPEHHRTVPMEEKDDDPGEIERRRQLARAWSAFLQLALDDRLDDGTPVLELVFAARPDLRRRLNLSVKSGGVELL